MANKVYQYRAYPTEEQKVMLIKTFGCVRMIYHYYLEQRITKYRKEKLSISYTQYARDLTKLNKEKALLHEVDSIALQQSLRHLNTANIRKESMRLVSA